MLKNSAVYSTKCTATAREKWRVLSNYKHDVCNCPINAQIRLLIANHVQEFRHSFWLNQIFGVLPVMFSPKQSWWPPFFYISDITNSSSFNGKIFRKKNINVRDWSLFMWRGLGERNHRGGAGPIFSKTRGGPKENFTMMGVGHCVIVKNESTMRKI